MTPICAPRWRCDSPRTAICWLPTAMRSIQTPCTRARLANSRKRWSMPGEWGGEGGRGGGLVVGGEGRGGEGAARSGGQVGRTADLVYNGAIPRRDRYLGDAESPAETKDQRNRTGHERVQDIISASA